jgi:glycosyltransferase involved in cell wall biosynthesis
LYERSVQVFIVPCAFLRAKMIAAGFAAERIRVIPHGTEIASVTPRYDHNGYFLYVGRLSLEKGVDTIIDLAKRLPDQEFKIVGTGPEEARLHERAHALGNVEFCGFQQGERLAQIVGDARAVLLPSRVHEVFPLTVLEAFAAGKPVIASHVGGVPEAVDDRHNGILVAPFDLHGWTEAVLRMAYDEPMRSRMARAAREAAETRFSLRKHFEAVEAVYAEVRRIVEG